MENKRSLKRFSLRTLLLGCSALAVAQFYLLSPYAYQIRDKEEARRLIWSDNKSLSPKDYVEKHRQSEDLYGSLLCAPEFGEDTLQDKIVGDISRYPRALKATDRIRTASLLERYGKPVEDEDINIKSGESKTIYVLPHGNTERIYIGSITRPREILIVDSESNKIFCDGKELKQAKEK